MIMKRRVCPVCGQGYYDAPALSRKDNKTLICPDCGTREALEEYEGASKGDKE